MNAIPLNKAKAIAQSFQDAVDNGEKSEQSFIDWHKGKEYYESIERTCIFSYDKLNLHDVCRFEIIERTVRDEISRVCIDNVESITVTDDESSLIIDAPPYTFCILIENDE